MKYKIEDNWGKLLKMKMFEYHKNKIPSSDFFIFPLIRKFLLFHAPYQTFISGIQKIITVFVCMATALSLKVKNIKFYDQFQKFFFNYRATFNWNEIPLNRMLFVVEMSKR